MNNKIFIIVVLTILCIGGLQAQRKITPVNTKGSATQPINELADDTARINAKIRANLAHFHDENGNIIYIDTITGKEWRDTTTYKIKKPMMYPLLHAASINVDLWNPLMRAFGQHYGLIGFGAQVSLHNRYFPSFETGLGSADNTPSDNNFTYKSPLSVYFRLGADYNLLYNSSPDYKFFVGLRFGLSPFKYDIKDITITSNYWDETVHPEIPTQSCTATWFELNVGLQVRLWGPISAGWSFRYHRIMNETKNPYGQPWYIPGFGSRSTNWGGTITLSYTINLNKSTISGVNLEDGGDSKNIYLSDSYGEPSPDEIQKGQDAQNPE